MKWNTKAQQYLKLTNKDGNFRNTRNLEVLEALYRRGVSNSTIYNTLMNANYTVPSLNNGLIGSWNENISFNGSTTKVDLGGNIVGTGDITWSGWINTTGFGEDVLEYIYCNGNFIIYSFDVAKVIMVNSDGSTNATTASNSVLINTWYNFAVTRAAGGAKTNMYLNGVQSGTTNQDSGTPAIGLTNDIIGNNNATTQTFDGDIHTIRIYDRILAAEEIVALYRQGR